MSGKQKRWKLKISGTIIIPSESFEAADALFAKAMKAIAEVWDVDVQGCEIMRIEREQND
ncbi:MAG: hypothetical protein PHF57_09270 [Methanoregula sp.]|nr:hypothetical protein [Methanoregula sp.]